MNDTTQLMIRRGEPDEKNAALRKSCHRVYVAHDWTVVAYLFWIE